MRGGGGARRHAGAGDRLSGLVQANQLSSRGARHHPGGGAKQGHHGAHQEGQGGDGGGRGRLVLRDVALQGQAM